MGAGPGAEQACADPHLRNPSRLPPQTPSQRTTRPSDCSWPRDQVGDLRGRGNKVCLYGTSAVVCAVGGGVPASWASVQLGTVQPWLWDAARSATAPVTPHPQPGPWSRMIWDPSPNSHCRSAPGFCHHLECKDPWGLPGGSCLWEQPHMPMAGTRGREGRGRDENIGFLLHFITKDAKVQRQKRPRQRPAGAAECALSRPPRPPEPATPRWYMHADGTASCVGQCPAMGSLHISVAAAVGSFLLCPC